MGYYTSFSLGLVNATSEAEEEEIIKKLQEESGEIFEGGDSEYYVFTKWYNSEKDVLEISKKFPHILFMVEGRGESGDDFWRRYVQDGKQQFTMGRMVFDDYDPSKMK